MSGPSADMQSELQRFFSGPNRLELDRIEQDEPDQGHGRFRRWIDPLRLPNPQETLLPCMRQPGRVDWYAVAFSDREMRTLGEEISAFVGPTYSHFRGERAHLDPADPVEAAVREMTSGRAYLVTAPRTPTAQRHLWEALERMRRVRARRAEREPEALRPIGRILRDFFLALRAGNREGAEDLLRALRDRFELGTWNLLFLQVQMLAALGRWEELRALAQKADLLRIRRPLAVTEALLAAVYHHELERFELRDDPAGAADHFAREVFPRFAPLFAYRTGMRSPEVLKSFLLLAVSAATADPELRAEILRIAHLPVAEQRYLERIAALAPEAAPEAPPADPLSRAIEAWSDGRFDDVFRLATMAAPSPERARLLLQCAFEIPALEVRGAAIEAVQELTAQARERLLGSRWAQTFWVELAGSAEQTTEPPAGWIEWLHGVEAGWDHDTATTFAGQGADQWEIEALLSVAGAVHELADGLVRGTQPQGEATIRDALPHLLAFVQKDAEWPRRDLLPLYNSLLFLLATTDRGGQDELNLFNELFSALLWLGLDPQQYRETVGWGIELWERLEAPRNVDWVLDLLDLLAGAPSPDEEIRSRLLQVVSGSFLRFQARGQTLQEQQWLLLRGRCRELGHPELVEAFPEAPAETEDGAAEREGGFARLAGRSVALYTLTESVGQRVAALLRQVCPTVTVEVRHDRVCTERLRAAARNADIFVMATASAKHASTGCIEANRSKDLPLLRPTGKGSASMLSALASFLGGA